MRDVTSIWYHPVLYHPVLAITLGRQQQQHILFHFITQQMLTKTYKLPLNELRQKPVETPGGARIWWQLFLGSYKTLPWRLFYLSSACELGFPSGLLVRQMAMGAEPSLDNHDAIKGVSLSCWRQVFLGSFKHMTKSNGCWARTTN